MPKIPIVWDKGGDEDRGRKSSNSFREKQLYRKNEKPYNKGKQSNPRGHDNLNNRVKLQHLESNPHDDVAEWEDNLVGWNDDLVE